MPRGESLIPITPSHCMLTTNSPCSTHHISLVRNGRRGGCRGAGGRRFVAPSSWLKQCRRNTHHWNPTAHSQLKRDEPRSHRCQIESKPTRKRATESISSLSRKLLPSLSSSRYRSHRECTFLRPRAAHHRPRSPVPSPAEQHERGDARPKMVSWPRRELDDRSS
jgi:hypothetical protein